MGLPGGKMKTVYKHLVDKRRSSGLGIFSNNVPKVSSELYTLGPV